MSALLVFALIAATPAEEVQVAVLDHAVRKGDLIEASDFAFEARTPAAARGAVAAEDASGMEASRNLSAGAIVRRTDLIRPQLVRRGEPVSLRIVQGPMAITASGRALASGAKGDIVRVVVTATRRTLDAVVESTGTVRLTTF